MTSNPSSPNSNSNSGYALAYPQTDSRTRGRVKLNSSPTSTNISDLFSPTNHHHHHHNTTTTTTNITIQNEQSTKLQNYLFYTFYSISLYLLKYSIEITNQPINLILLFTSLTLIITPLIPSNHNFITNRLSTGTPQKLFNNPNNDNNPNHKKNHPSLNSSPPTILFTALYSLGLLILHVSFFFALSHLSVLRIILLTCSSNQWSHSLSDLILKPFKTQQTTYIANTHEGFIIIGILSACLAIDLHFTSNSPLDSNRLVAGYLSVLTYLISQGFTQSNQHQMKVLKKSKNKRAAEILNAGIGAGIGVFTFLTSTTESLSTRIYGTVTLSLFFNTISTYLSQSITNDNQFSIATISSFLIGATVFGNGFGIISDYIISIVFYIGLSNISPQTHYSSVTTNSTPQNQMDKFLDQYRKFKGIIKTVLDNPESKRIAFFLCLNLAYMLVQMMYGIWTNSLGLISDSIHMFFDCMALAMGLFASVMSTWPADSRFPYGYGRVETLSGFTNGVFLLLISLFIIFEAIQRLLDPPEMNTNQLLVVSSVGLGVNLVGMFATGHHHHHHGGGGHHHHHGHSHDHGHQEEKTKDALEHSVTQPGPDHAHSAPDHGHSHSSHHHAHSPQDHAHSSHDHGHSHDHDHSHHHSHPNDDGHAHSSHDHGHCSHNHHSSPTVHDHTHSANPKPATVAVPKGGCSHSHAHSHNMKGVFLHVMADTLGSLGVIISTILIERYGWTGFDPLASIFIATLIAGSVYPLVIDCGKILLLDLGTERENQLRVALLKLGSIEGLSSYSTPKFWPKDSFNINGTIHIQLEPNTSTLSSTSDQFIARYDKIELIKNRVINVLKSNLNGLDEIIVQVEGVDGVLGCNCLVRTNTTSTS